MPKGSRPVSCKACGTKHPRPTGRNCRVAKGNETQLSSTVDEDVEQPNNVKSTGRRIKNVNPDFSDEAGQINKKLDILVHAISKLQDSTEELQVITKK